MEQVDSRSPEKKGEREWKTRKEAGEAIGRK